jgi:ABC-type bacteriocin/lantibiotic exporter with double-glycine peptidase domain
MRIKNFPELRQIYNYDCGASALESIFMFYGKDVREDEIMRTAGTNPRVGTNIEGIIKTAREYGFSAKVKKMNIDKVKKYLNRNIPVIINLQAWTEQKNVKWSEDWIDGHYVVAIGYDDDKIIFEDPSSIVRTYLKYDEFMQRWHSIYKNGNINKQLGIIITPRRRRYFLRNMIHMD